MRIRRRVKKRIYKFILFVLTICFLGILLYSGYNIYTWYKENKHSSNMQKMLEEYTNIEISDEPENNKFSVDFVKLREFNDDVVAYLKVFNTNIEFPVVKAKDNDYYLTHSFDKRYNTAGWIFANYVNTFDGQDKNISLFGHGRLDGSMFGSLKDTLTSTWQKENPSSQVVLVTDDDVYYYNVFATYKVLVEDYYLQNSFASDEDYLTFLKTLMARSNYDYGVSLTSDDQILTLSTCDVNNKYRIVLHAKKIIDSPNDED